MAIEVAGVVARLGFNVDDDGANRFERKIRDLRSDAKRPVVAPLKGEIQGKDLDLYDRKLTEIRDKVRRRDAFKAKLGADFDSRAFSAYERETARAIKHTDDNVRAQGRLRTAFGSVSSAGAGMFAAAGGGYAVYAGLKSIITASGDAEASAKRVATAVDNAGISYSRHADHIDEVIQKQSQLARFDDEDLADSFGRIVGLTKDVNEALQMNALGADVARARQIDLDAGVKIVTKAYLGQVAGLKRIGIDIKPVTTEQDKLKESTKDSTQAQKDAAKEADNLATRHKALAELQKTFGGQAREYGRTQKGAIDGLKVAWENLQEVLGKKLAPVITDVANKLTKFVTGMTEGRGEGGRFVKRLKEIWDRLVTIYDAFVDANRVTDEFWRGVVQGAKEAADTVLGLASTVLGVFADIASAGAKLKIPGMKGISEDLRDMQHDLDKTREGLRKVDDQANKVDMSKVRRENHRTAEAFDDMAKRGKVSLRDIARTTDTRSKEIRDDLGGRSEEGKRALAGNFREAMAAVRRQMAAGKTSTKEGMQAIRGYLADELRVYGLNIAEGQKLVGEHPFSNKLGASSPFAKKAGGGWIGAPGQAGMDTVPAMLAPGEAVLNRHQQAVIEGMLGGGFLDQLFARVQTPHYMAKGGMVAAANRLDAAHFPYVWGGGHQASPTPFGPVDCSGAVSYVLQQGGVGIPTMTSGQLMRAGKPGPGQVTVYANPEHTLMSIAGRFFGTSASNPGGGAGWMPTPDASYLSRFTPRHFTGGMALAQIARRIVNGGGMVGGAVQGALDMSRAGAQAYLTRKVGSMGLGTGDANNPALGGPARSIARRMLGSFGFGQGQFAPLDQLWQGESGWNPRATNRSSGAYGIPQALPGSKMAAAGADWRTNPATQIRWGLGYIKDRYGSPANAYSTWLGRSPHWYARGGRAVQRFDKGGRAQFEASQSQTTAAATRAEQRAAQGFALRSRRRTLAHRIGDYENYMGAVETVRKRYSIAERIYNRIDEGSLVNEETGEVNTEAVESKARAIMQMMLLAGQIVHYLEEARKVAKRVVRSYKSIVSRLRSSLKHAKKKDRSGIREQLKDAASGRDEYIGIVGDLGFDITNAKFDVEDLVKERNEILGTTGRAADTTSTDTGTDTTTDVQAIADQATARAVALAADLSTVRANFAAFTSTGDLGSGQGTSALGSALVDAAGGVGGANMAGIPGAFIDGGGGVTVIVQTQSLVPGSHAESLRVADAVTGALAVRPVRPVTQMTVG